MSNPASVTHVEHIGIAVRDLAAATLRYETLLGVPCYATEEVPSQMVRTAFFKVGETKIELLESTSPDGPIGKFIEKRGEGIHHIAYAVGNIHLALHGLEEGGFTLLDREPKRGAEGLEIAFLHPKSTGGVLTEMCQKP
jgi:methylmalonyl-CoA/ethylmalonyl-CoA epimerase